MRSLVLAPLLLAACEKPFEPLAPTDLVFSIYGHLDAAADTQWVRVMPIRESLELPPGSIDAVVTLEELETGTTVEMSDSMFRYLPLFGDAELYAHNFSTTMPLVPGRHYRLAATRSDGAAASATVLIPVFQEPTLVINNAYLSPASPNSRTMGLTYGTVRGTRHLGMVLGREDIPGRCNWPFPIHQQFLPVTSPAAIEGADHVVQLSWPVLPGEGQPSYVAAHPPSPFEDEELEDRTATWSALCNLGPKRILAIAAGEPWPHGVGSRLRELSHPTTIDNIEGRGLGFLAGVQTYVFPFAGCIPLQRESPCAINFGPRSATLVGTVRNRCTDARLDSMQVRLLSPPTNAIRYDTTDLSGAFEFQGLEPGLEHSLALAQILAPSDFNGPDYNPTEVEVEAVPEAAVNTVSIGLLPRLNWCS